MLISGCRGRLFQLGMGYGVRKMTARVWRVFLLLRSTFPDPYPPRYESLCGSKWPKINKIFDFRVWNMGCPIEWANYGDHFMYSDRLVYSAISWVNRADRPRTLRKYSLLPFQILSFAQGRKNWSPARRGPIFSTAGPYWYKFKPKSYLAERPSSLE